MAHDCFPGRTAALLSTTVLALLLSGVAAAKSVSDVDARGRTVIGDATWDKPGLAISPKVVYGNDDRIDVYAATDPDQIAWTRSTCGLTYWSRLSDNGNGTYTLATSPYSASGYPPCAEEPFADQVEAMWCTGFVVGEDLIATAGHCYDTGDLASVAFVFGFWMTGASTVATVLDESQVYTGVEVVGHQLSGDYDYAVVRVDRAITAPGALPLPIRRVGGIGVGEPVGVIGHPSGLPMKIAFGAQTAVRDAGPAGYFVANLDTYGGNSGSPVWNQNTGLVEGILVRGETDYVIQGSCFVSNTVSDAGGRGEDVSKTTSFMQYVPELLGSEGTVALDREYYGCSDTATVTVEDNDLAGNGQLGVSLISESGDAELLGLDETALPGRFTGTIAIAQGAPTTSSGVVEAAEGETITVTYLDADDGTKAAAVVTDTAIIDCTPPQISGVSVTEVTCVSATIAFQTNESARGSVDYGASCGSLGARSSGVSATSHSVVVQGLSPLTTYHFAVAAEDEAGNVSGDDNGGLCYTFTTLDQPDYFTETFESDNDLSNSQLTLIPDGSEDFYAACTVAAAQFPVDPTGGTELSLLDDNFVSVTLSGGARVSLYGIAYASFFVSSNGSLTFTTGDTTWEESLIAHFLQPRVSGLFDDLDPTSGGIVSWKQLSDRAAVSYEALPEYDTVNSNSFQIELFFDGLVRITWLGIEATDGTVGISEGLGLPAQFAESDLSAYPACSAEGEGEGALPIYHTADQDESGHVSLGELMRVVQFHNSGGYHCDASSEDGFAPGPGTEDCRSHGSDYNPRDWLIGLRELLRIIQFYNVGAYHQCAAGEDGYCAGAV